MRQTHREIWRIPLEAFESNRPPSLYIVLEVDAGALPEGDIRILGQTDPRKTQSSFCAVS